MKNINIPHELNQINVAELHTAFKKLKIEIAPAKPGSNEMDDATRSGISKFQEQAGLRATGKLTPETVTRLNLELAHTFYSGSKTRTANIHGMLSRVGLQVDPAEIKNRTFGDSTKQAFAEFQKTAGIAQDGRVNDSAIGKLGEAALKARFSTKTQVGQLHRDLLRVGNITKLEIKIDPTEFQKKEVGATTRQAISEFQKKYRLPITGELNPTTYERIQSVAASRPLPVKTLKAQSAVNLSPINKVLRLNATNKHVGELQQALAFMGHKIDEKEFNTKKFGKTTREAVLAYQRQNNLPVTGHAEAATIAKLNLEIKDANPQSFTTEYPFRIKGSVRDDLWQGKAGIKVQVFEKLLRGEGKPIAERKTLSNGFFDIPYDPPRNPVDGQIKVPFHLQIKILDQNGTELDSKVLFNPTMIAWVNFTDGKEPYRGTSEYETRMKAVQPKLNNIPLADIEESEQHQEITYITLNSGLLQDDVMRLVLSHRVAKEIDNAIIKPDVVYAFIRQNLPPNLPSDLLGSTQEWTLISQLVNQTTNGLVFMEGDLQSQAFDNAIKENLIAIATGRQKDQILAAFTSLQQTFALDKPILIGNGNLKALLDASQVTEPNYNKIANAFLQHKGLGTEFWTDIKARAGEFGGDTVVRDFETTVYLGHITKNNSSTLSFLKAKIADPAETRINAPSDLAKFTQAEWVSLVQENGGTVPTGTDGNTPEEKINIYAATLAFQSEQLFPAIAFAADVARSDQHDLQKVPEIQQLLDAHTELDLRTTSLDKFVKESGVAIAEDVLGEAKVMQRVHRITPTATLGTTLLEAKIHSSSQVVSLGKERLVDTLAAKGIDQTTALTIYGTAEFQYAQVLRRITDYRAELYRLNPRAIINYSYSAEEQQELLGAIPNLRTLFGSLDYCDCEHCQSVYGPSAYLADVLRFLESHRVEKPNAAAPNRTVRDILFDRRPDIGNIKLNCDNTNIPLPYIDLVCEILENAVPAPGTNANFSFQTTRTREELRAFPENVRKDAYDLLKTANYPINSSFNLWQEEARVFLQHLGVSRHELMETFQAKPSGGTPSPTDLSIAGEFFGVSTYETNLITTLANTSAQQDIFWGLNTTRNEVVVSEFLHHAKLEYGELLEMLYVRWLNPTGGANNLTLQRPADNCNLDAQRLVNFTIDKFDQIHRFLRLWQQTSWKMWELDLLIRAERVGNSNIDDPNTLVRLQQFKQIQNKLGLSFEFALSFYHQINTEVRVRPDQPDKEIQPLYINLFQNPAIINPINARFALPLSGTEDLSNHKATLLAACAITETDLALLIEKTDGKLTLINLTSILNQVNLARGLKISVMDLLTLEILSGIVNVFASPRHTLDLIELHEWVKISGFQIQELDYLLNYQPDSPYGLREESITQYIQALRDSLRSASPEQKEGQIIAQIATSFSLTGEQTQLLLKSLDLEGEKIIQHLSDSKLTEKDSNDQYTTAISLGNFSTIYGSYRLLQKASLLVQRHKIVKDDLEWLLQNFGVIQSLNFSQLPVSANPATSLFSAWLSLHKWLYFKSQYPQPEGTSLNQIFDLAQNPTSDIANIRTAISELTTWKIKDLEDLHTGLQLQHGATSSYTNIDTYIRLWQCFKQIKRIGVDASMLLAWAKRDNDTSDAQFVTAQQIKQAAKSKYDYSVWLSKVTPLQDELREKKRTALIRYLVEHSLQTEQQQLTFRGKQFANPKHWKDSNDLLSYFLIDVEMSACQLTSRIKQAIGSVQMFVQRCFLNLEQPYVEVSREEREDTVSLNSWKQWKWMKSYRIWEANRKVFLYPENWIEPELRDDKSPFFKEFENEILQNEITHDNAESTFLHYLQKVHEVSRLEVAGIYHELDDDNPYDNLPPNINVLHVIGRTKSQPAIYYYRQFDLNYNIWTAWEKIDLDITGDHVIPVVYNRRLHLFWLSFVEKPQKIKKQPPAKASDAPTDSPEPPKMLEIQLMWSVRKDGGWAAKKISQQKLIHPWERPLFSYNLKPRYKSRENLLWLDIYISTSQEFNNTRFYDPYKSNNGAIVKEYLTATRYNETGRPWHSSSFVFDGDIVDLKLKPLTGQYHILDNQGIALEGLTQTTSYQYVHDNFGETGRRTKELGAGGLRAYEIAPRLVLPDGMHYHNNHLVNNKTRPNTSQLNVLESGATRNLLQGAQSPFEIVFSQHQIWFDTATWGQPPFFYQDNFRSFFIKPEWQTVILGYNQTLQRLKYSFLPFYHPYTALFIRELNRSGLDGLLTRKIQQSPQSYYPGNSFNFNSTYRPISPNGPDVTAERDIVDFSRYGAYSIYNWEIFFHAPFMIACKLTQNQRFEEAMRWFHYIFDPTNVEALSVPQRYWVTKPFFDQNSEDYRKQRIENLLADIDKNLDHLREWKNNPFKPHLIARHRLVAYQKAIVMKYIDNLIAWGDQLFRRDTIESMNEATTLYVLAYELLGPRPVKVPNIQHSDYSYNELVADGSLDPFGNRRVDVLLENFTGQPVQVVRTQPGTEPLPKIDVFYFSIPNNDKLLEYWNAVEDRLFKIRHCMNIEGVVRQLPLFEPPIDPALLVKAAAAGVDLSSVLSDAAAPQGQYRFRTLAAKAAEFCNEVKALGDKLLSVIEKKDAEGLALLRSANEVKLLEAIKVVRKQQINEAKETWEGLEKGLDVLDKRIEYYGSIPYMNTWEDFGVTAHGLGIISEIVATVASTVAAGAHLAPKIKAGASGFGGSPLLTLEFGGENIANSSGQIAALFQGLASILHQGGAMLETQGRYARQDDENKFQKEISERDKIQLNKQIEAARIRYLIAQKELDNQDLQIEQSESVDEYMRSKYTNQQLYDWMIGQLATIYFQSYQLAFDMAKRAEKCFQFELCKSDTSFIQFGYWDSLKKGLLSGEKLINDIHRMETAYLDQHKRELEITKHVSLAQFMPLNLLTLKETGSCMVVLPEWLFDMDYPGHYRRKIKSVSITIPCVVGPYTNVNCTLSLTNNAIRLTEDVAGGYGDPLADNESRFARNPVPIQSIATSHGQNDTGVFELNFQDERYLPFEGAGAVSEWQISLPKENNQFDFATISDVILHIRHTAKAGNSNLVTASTTNLSTVLPTKGFKLFVLNHEFGSAWHRLFNPETNADQILAFSLKPEHLPFYARNKNNRITKVDLIIESNHGGNFDSTLQLPGANPPTTELMSKDPNFGGMHHLEKSNIPPSTNLLGDWRIQFKKDSDPTFRVLKPEDIGNAYLVVSFSVQ